MSWQEVRLKDVSTQPWRNGGGVTRELLAWPHAQDWIWRMSVAEVVRSGPFSRFEGVQRWFAVLSGAGVRLTIDAGTAASAQTHDLTCNSAPLCFDGALAVDCQLPGGETQDFNLMLRRDKAAALMKRVSGLARFVLDTPKIIAVYAISTGASVLFEHISKAIPARTLAWQSLPAGATVQLESADALWMEIELWA